MLATRAFGFERSNLLLNGVDGPPAPSLLPGPLNACFPLQRLLRRSDALARRRGVDEAWMKRDVAALLHRCDAVVAYNGIQFNMP